MAEETKKASNSGTREASVGEGLWPVLKYLIAILMLGVFVLKVLDWKKSLALQAEQPRAQAVATTSQARNAPEASTPVYSDPPTITTGFTSPSSSTRSACSETAVRNGGCTITLTDEWSEAVCVNNPSEEALSWHDQGGCLYVQRNVGPISGEPMVFLDCPNLNAKIRGLESGPTCLRFKIASEGSQQASTVLVSIKKR